MKKKRRKRNAARIAKTLREVRQEVTLYSQIDDLIVKYYKARDTMSHSKDDGTIERARLTCIRTLRKLYAEIERLQRDT